MTHEEFVTWLHREHACNLPAAAAAAARQRNHYFAEGDHPYWANEATDKAWREDHDRKSCAAAGGECSEGEELCKARVGDADAAYIRARIPYPWEGR